MGGLTALKTRLLKVMASFEKRIDTNKIGYIPMLLLLVERTQLYRPYVRCQRRWLVHTMR
jgi:hypothetical protein